MKVGIQELLVTVAGTPRDTEIVVDIAGNGKALLPVAAVEVRDGKLVIECEAPKAKTQKEKPVKAKPVEQEQPPAEPNPAPADETAPPVVPQDAPKPDAESKPAESIELK